jgi:hypothetical protein
MNDRQKCLNHPERHAVSFCHGCGKFFCEECLVEGPEYYYCRRESCMKLYEQAVEAARESQPIVEPTSQLGLRIRIIGSSISLVQIPWRRRGLHFRQRSSSRPLTMDPTQVCGGLSIECVIS